MDTTQYTDYVEKHKIFQLFEDLLQQLILHKPENPLDFLIHYLRTTHGPKIILIAPPGLDTNPIGEHLHKKFGVLGISLKKLAEEESDNNNMDQLLEYLHHNIESAASEDLAIRVLKEKLSTEECTTRGWILLDFPRTRRQALKMQSAGILPDKVFLLESKHDIKRVLDENSILNTQHQTSENGNLPILREGSGHYYRHLNGLLACYRNLLKKFSVDGGTQQLLETIVQFLEAPPREQDHLGVNF